MTAGHTWVETRGDRFFIDGRPTGAGREYLGHSVEGLLPNARLVQGVFDDLNPGTRGRWAYPDGPWDPERNTREFLAAMPVWRAHGLLAFTINLQGGSPEGYSRQQPWHNSAYEPSGRLRQDYLARLATILERADALGMAVILGLFYFGQDERLVDEAAVQRAADDVTDWILAAGYRHVLIEICNETDVPRYEHPVLCPGRVAELVERVQKRSAGRLSTGAGRLLVSVSTGGGAQPPDTVLECADFVLLHGNGVAEPATLGQMVQQCRACPAYRGQPILFNEDDHYDFEQRENHFLAALEAGVGWGYFDWRRPGEGFDEGYQSVPVNWQISSARKRGFFTLLAQVTGAAPAATVHPG